MQNDYERTYAASGDKNIAKMQNIKIMKERIIQLITAAILSIGGLALLFTGVLIEPQGQIHESLLVAFGEVATFSGALMGIDYVYKKRS